MTSSSTRWKARRILRCGIAFSLLVGWAHAVALASDFVVVRDGGPEAQIIIPDNASPVVRLAASELQQYVAQATGARLDILPRIAAVDAGSKAIYLNTRRQMQAVGFSAGDHAPNTFRIARYGEGLLIAGVDGGGDPLSPATAAGTLLGVYHFLEHELGVRWNHPGKGGVVVPERPTLAVGQIDILHQPHLAFIRFGDGSWDEAQASAQTFGAAAEPVQRYFAYWRQAVGHGIDPATPLPHDGGHWLLRLAPLFDEAALERGEAILHEGRVAAEGDPPSVHRVEFLQRGLEYARLTLRAMRAYDAYRAKGDVQTAQTFDEALDAWDASREALADGAAEDNGFLHAFEDRRGWRTAARD